MKQPSAAKDLISQVTPESWRGELEKTSLTYHLIAAWAAIIFDPIFAFTDYINIPENWRQLLYVRLCVSAIVLTMVITRQKFRLPSYFIVAGTRNSSNPG